jgi:hypothetical protein
MAKTFALNVPQAFRQAAEKDRLAACAPQSKMPMQLNFLTGSL